MTLNQLTNIIKIMGDKTYEKKETVIRILEEKLDTTKLDFSQNQKEKDRVIFIYEGYKYRLAINSKGLLQNFIECQNFSNIIADSKINSINPYNFLVDLESFGSEDNKYNLCTKEYVTSSLRRKEDFKLIRSTTSNLIIFNSIKYNSRLYFYFKVFIELSRNFITIDSIDSCDFNFIPNLFQLNNFLNIYPKSMINLDIKFDLEEFLDNPNMNFLNENEYKVILSYYENEFNNLDKHIYYNTSYDFSYDNISENEY